MSLCWNLPHFAVVFYFQGILGIPRPLPLQRQPHARRIWPPVGQICQWRACSVGKGGKWNSCHRYYTVDWLTPPTTNSQKTCPSPHQSEWDMSDGVGKVAVSIESTERVNCSIYSIGEANHTQEGWSIKDTSTCFIDGYSAGSRNRPTEEPVYESHSQAAQSNRKGHRDQTTESFRNPKSD